MTQLLFVSGSLRAASTSTAMAKTLSNRLANSANCSLSNIGDLPHYNDDLLDQSSVAGWIKQIDGADGLVFITPEYNYSIPGVLKNAIDWASRPALKSVFAGKKCFVISVSAGAMGGVRAQGHLKYILNGMLADVYLCPEIVVPMVLSKVENEVMKDEGTLSFSEEHLRKFIASL